MSTAQEFHVDKSLVRNGKLIRFAESSTGLQVATPMLGAAG